MSDHRIVYVDFVNQVKIKEDIIKEERLDPILAEVKEQLSEENFEVYKRVIDDWMSRHFSRQMENGELKF